MAKAQKDAFNQQTGFLDNTLQPQTQKAWYDFLAQNQDAAQRISGLYSQPSVDAANQGFDSGVSQYEQRASDMYNNAGYTPEEQQGQKVATAAGFAAPYADAVNQLKLQQQRTGNAAGVNNTIAKLGREKGQMISAGLGGLQKGFGDARIAGQQQALSLSQFPQMARLQRLGTEQTTAGLGLTGAAQKQGAYGTGVQGQLGATQIRAGNVAANPGFTSTLGSSLAGALGKSLGSIGMTFGG